MPKRRRRSTSVRVLLLLLLLLLGAAGAYLLLRSTPEPRFEPPPEPEATAPQADLPSPAPEPEWAMGAGSTTQPPEPVAPAVELPPLDQSDALLRELAATLSANPAWARWLAPDDLIRRFVAAVDNVAERKSPRAHLRFLAPSQPFEVEVREEQLFLTARGTRRYDTVAAVVSALDTRGCLELYEQLRPLIDQSFRELGYPEGDFTATLRQAIAHLLATPVPSEPIGLVPGVLTYEFRDLELEDLSPAQKHLLRMGPRNVARIQAKLREIEEGLN